MNTATFAKCRAQREPLRLLPCLFAALLAAGCGGSGTSEPKPPPPPPPNSDPVWITQATPHNRIAVVFVHGIFGDTKGTWEDGNGHSFFDLLASSPELKVKIDEFAFGFTSNMFKNGSLDIREAANMLEQTLEFKGVWQYDTVVFVAHSMGGLVVMREIVSHQEHREKIPLLLLYATPSEGSQITAIAEHVVNNPAIKQMFLADGNDFLKQLSDDWGLIDADHKPTVICAYETMPTDGAMIVPWSSATRMCNGAPTAIQSASHITIVKPDRSDHPSVMVAVNALNNLLGNSNVLLTPDFQPMGDGFVYNVTNIDGRNPARLVNDGPRSLRYTITQVSSPQLMVLPDDTPKMIPANHADELQVVLLRGNLQSEYRFVLQVPPFPDRTVVVKLPDPKHIQEQQMALAHNVSVGVANYLSEEKIASLNRLPEDQQLAQVAEAARDAVGAQVPNLPKNAQWVLTADTLAAAGWSQLAGAALHKVQEESPATAKSSSVTHLASVVSAQSGKPNVIDLHIDQVKNKELLAHYATTSDFIDPKATQNWEVLAKKMQSVSALRAYGMGLEGDLSKVKGDNGAARNIYMKAANFDTSPLLQEKMRAIHGLPDKAEGKG